MSYVSLARKYRPRRFVDMVGQEATTLALTNAIRLRREPHSVIFTGVRGVGKTTSARIYAKALNCEQGPTAEPCDVCASCLAISAGHHEDVLEIDGASNTGVDDVRALQETLGYVPQRSTYKVYIIDEVHMLSISAFNALLKTLEEPPKHVIFIFATTELHKVPETIQSRCQTFHLQKISRPVIVERIRSILSAEQIPYEEGALALVAREGRGSLRDALTMLDQVIAVGGGQVSLDALKHMAGGSQSLPVLELLEGLLQKNATQILEVIARWDQEGLSMSGLAEETAKACRNAFILKDLKGQAIDLQILELEDREQQFLLELAEKSAPMDLNRLFRQLAKCLDDLRHADLDRFVLENYCLEWCFDPGLPDLQSLMGMLSGQALPQAQQQAIMRPAAPQSQPQMQTDGTPAPAAAPSINLRDRWKTSSPQAAAAKPAAPQAPMQNATRTPEPAAMQAPVPNPLQTPAPQAPVQNAMRAPEPAVMQAPVPNPLQTPAPQAPVQNAMRAPEPAAMQAPVPNPLQTPAPQAPVQNAMRAPEPAVMQAPVPNPLQTPAPQAPVQNAIWTPEGATPQNEARVSMPNAVQNSVRKEPEPAPPPMQASPALSPLQRLRIGGQAQIPEPKPLPNVIEFPVTPPPEDIPAPAKETKFPDTWRGFVDEWKKQKPLQGRVLEEAYVLEYTPQRIRLAVEPQSMVGGKLLQQDVRKRLQEQFTLLFGFQGQLEVVAKGDTPPQQTGQAAVANPLGETLLEVKNREREVARENLKTRLEGHPMTREVISRFGGTIEQIELQ